MKRSFSKRLPSIRFALATVLASFWFGGQVCSAEEASAVESRLKDHVGYLASDALEGRGVGTKGIDQAADFIAEQFRQAGLKTELFDGRPFQKFSMVTGAKLGDTNALSFAGPDDKRITLKLGQEFNPLAIGGSGKLDLPLMFVGYGITGKDEKYDDYAGLDVKGKAVVILRHQPEQGNPHSAFGGPHPSEHAPFRRKVSNAYEHGAAAVIFVNDEFDLKKKMADLEKRRKTAEEEIAAENADFKAKSDADAKPSAEQVKEHEEKIARLTDDLARYSKRLADAQDPIVGFSEAGNEGTSGRDFPVVFCQRAALDPVVKAATGMSLGELEAKIDEGPTPKSQELAGWRVVGETQVVREQSEVKNVVGVLEGEGSLADETIVIGAHYDHLGWGGEGSTAPGVHEIHNGADDNGSGATVLVEVARQLASLNKKLPRRVVFIAFTGEERGLVGSARYVKNPLFPLDKVVAMLNMDMVGRLTDEKLIVHGTGTAAEFDALVDRFGKEHGFTITKKPGGFGPSDHSSFYSAKIPVLFFFTGSHKDYHRPSDDVDKLNVAGMRRIGSMVAQIAIELAEAPQRPHRKEVQEQPTLGGGGDRPYFGSIPDFAEAEPGYALSGVTKGGPAERGGLQAGDLIILLGESKIGNLEDFDSALRKHKAGDKVPVIVKRAGKEVKLEVTLDPPR